MVKRKRDGKNQNLDEERHSKIRVQEVEHATASAKNDTIDDTSKPLRVEEKEDPNRVKSSGLTSKQSRKKKRSNCS